MRFFIGVVIAGFLINPSSSYSYNRESSQAKFQLGRLLFFDKILSGNRNISCATCHHPRFATSDGLSLGVGEGGFGVGTERKLGLGKAAIRDRVPRHAPALFNLGHTSVNSLFYDGRIHFDRRYPSNIKSPAGMQLPKGLDGLLAAQAMFPVQSAAEMAGHKGENTVADAASRKDLAGPHGVWNLLAKRLQSIPQYRQLF